MLSVVFEQRHIQVRKKAREHYERCKANGLCPACGEPIKESDEVQREVHMRCYHATYRAVAAGKTTWAERQKEGRIGPAGKPGRRPSNPVSVELA